MNKRQWILSQSEALNITNPNDLWSYLLTTQSEIENISPQANVPMYVDAGFDSLTFDEVVDALI